MTTMHGQSATHTAELRCIVDESYLDQVHEMLDGLWHTAAVAQEDAMRFGIAALEIAGNLLQHGLFDQPLVQSGDQVVVAEWTVEVDRSAIRARCRDSSAPIDGAGLLADRDPVTTLDDLGCEHGRGLALARRSVDTVVYRRLADPAGWVNEWTLERRRSA
ncbi:ATP-binding protein [Nakamurella leprariae]|uniref:ATP-binding protein n=1 Tax=Nakamurella leprariae TaxID=2803911 RepID=A0A938YA54_9ACTN|nr:ATP-binding protein [Nakamurella leprariae]MBM9466802.1 ATP-binding protein [Nakamurella leprariae]